MSVADKGIYTVSIASHLNTTPAYTSEDSYLFTVTLEDDPCSTILFDAQSLGPLYFEIAPGSTPTNLFFSDYTNDSGQFDCGSRKYQVVQSHTGMTFSEPAK